MIPDLWPLDPMPLAPDAPKESAVYVRWWTKVLLEARKEGVLTMNRRLSCLLLVALVAVGCGGGPGAPSPVVVERVGSWTPILGGSVSTSGQVYASQHGEWHRTGSLVNVFATITLRRKGEIVGHLEIQGLPFTSAPAHDSSCTFGDFDQTGRKHAWVGGIINSGVRVVWLRTRQDLVMSLMDTEDITDDTALQMHCTYLTNEPLEAR